MKLLHSLLLISAAFLPQNLWAQEPKKVEVPSLESMKASSQTAAIPSPAQSSNDTALRKALTEAYSKNPQLEAARKAQNTIDERVPQALSGALPTASLGYETGQRRTAFDGSKWRYGEAESKTLSVTQPLFRGGSTRANVKSARREVEAGQARLLQTEQEVLLNTITSYMDVVRAKSVVDLSKKNLEVLQKQQVAASQRFEVGEDTRTDVAQSDARVAAARSQLTLNEGRLASVQAVFERLVGYKLKDIDMPSTNFPIPASLEETIKLARENNPRVMEAESLKEASDYQIDANAGRLLPSANLRGSMARQQGAGVLGQSAFDQDEVVLAVSIPLFQGGAEYSRLRESKEEYQRRRFNEVSAIDLAQQEAIAAWETWRAAEASLTSDLSAIDAATIALDGVKQEQQYGTRTTLDVLDAERELFDAQVRYVTSQRDEVVAKYGLLAAIGQLNGGTLKLDTPLYDPNKHFEDVEYQFIGF